MWNPFKLRSAEARRIDIAIAELSDDVGKLTQLVGRLDARARKQSSRAAEGVADSVGASPERTLAVSNGAPSSVDRQTLVERARRQGLIR